MFQFPALAPCIRTVMRTNLIGLSHSEISGSKVICTYPELIAAYHVLLRLREPRHPPCALSFFINRSYFQLIDFNEIIKKNLQFYLFRLYQHVKERSPHK